MSRRGTKLQRAVHALASISFLDQDDKSQLADAIKLAEEALRDIDRDEMRITMKTDEPAGKITMCVSSAAGNSARSKELAPLFIDVIDSIVEAQGGKPVEWTPLP